MQTRKVITFDIDGVISKTGHVENPADRTPAYYFGLNLLDDDIPKYISSLSKDFDIYFITSRSFENVLGVTKLWLQLKGIGCNLYTGLMALRATTSTRDEESFRWKQSACEIVKSSFHVDDDPRILSYTNKICPSVLFDNPSWELNQQTKDYIRVFNWKELLAEIQKISN